MKVVHNDVVQIKGKNIQRLTFEDGTEALYDGQWWTIYLSKKSLEWESKYVNSANNFLKTLTVP